MWLHFPPHTIHMPTLHKVRVHVSHTRKSRAGVPCTHYAHVDVPINDIVLPDGSKLPPQFWCLTDPATGKLHLFTLVDDLPDFLEPEEGFSFLTPSHA